MAWIEARRGKNGTTTWFVYWREAGRGSRKKPLKAGRRRRDAERLAIEIQARVNAGLVGAGVVAKRVTLGEFADKWLAMRIARLTTVRRDRGLINTYLRPAFDGTLLNAITVEEIRALLSRVAKEQSPATARRLLAVLSKMMGDAMRSDYVRQNPVDKLDRREKPQVRRRAQAIDLDEIVRLLEILPGRWAPFALMAVLTGLRWGEIVALEWTDVDFEAGKINVRRATPVGTTGPQDPKSLTSQRSIDLLWPVRQMLLDLPQRGRLLFPGARGGTLSHGWFNKHIWHAATDKIGGHLRFHDLRHGFASLLLSWNESILYISQQLGHSSAAFTLSTYTHLIQQERKLDKDGTLQRLFAAARRDRTALIGEPVVKRPSQPTELEANTRGTVADPSLQPGPRERPEPKRVQGASTRRVAQQPVPPARLIGEAVGSCAPRVPQSETVPESGIEETLEEYGAGDRI